MSDREPPLLDGDALPLVRVEDFCHSAGIDAATAARVVRELGLAHATNAEGRLVALLEGSVPTADQLRDLGLTVRPEYDPSRLEHGPHDGPPSWTMGWDD